MNFFLCDNQPFSAPDQLIWFQLAFQQLVFLGSSWVPNALQALFFVAANHFWPPGQLMSFTLLSNKLMFSGSPGCLVPSWHSSWWQTPTFGPFPTHVISPCFPKFVFLGSPCGCQVPSWHSSLWLGKTFRLEPTTFVPLPTPFFSLAFPIAWVSWLPLGGSPWVPNTLLELFFVITNHFLACISWLLLGATCPPCTIPLNLCPSTNIFYSMDPSNTSSWRCVILKKIYYNF